MLNALSDSTLYFIKKPITLDDLVNRISKIMNLEDQSNRQSSSPSSSSIVIPYFIEIVIKDENCIHVS